jgi:hypothetical protein
MWVHRRPVAAEAAEELQQKRYLEKFFVKDATAMATGALLLPANSPARRPAAGISSEKKLVHIQQVHKQK